MPLGLQIKKHEAIDMLLKDGSVVTFWHKKHGRSSSWSLIIQADPSVVIRRRKIEPHEVPDVAMPEEEAFVVDEPSQDIAPPPPIDNRPLGRRLSTFKPWERKESKNGLAV